MGFSRDGADGEGLPQSFFGEGSGFGRLSTAQHRHRQSAARAARRSLSWPHARPQRSAQGGGARFDPQLALGRDGKAGFVTPPLPRASEAAPSSRAPSVATPHVSVRESASDFIILRRSSAWRVAVPFATASSFSTSASRSLACSTSASSRCCVDAPIATGEPGCGSAMLPRGRRRRSVRRRPSVVGARDLGHRRGGVARRAWRRAPSSAAASPAAARSCVGGGEGASDVRGDVGIEGARRVEGRGGGVGGGGGVDRRRLRAGAATASAAWSARARAGVGKCVGGDRGGATPPPPRRRWRGAGSPPSVRGRAGACAGSWRVSSRSRADAPADATRRRRVRRRARGPACPLRTRRCRRRRGGDGGVATGRGRGGGGAHAAAGVPARCGGGAAFSIIAAGAAAGGHGVRRRRAWPQSTETRPCRHHPAAASHASAVGASARGVGSGGGSARGGDGGIDAAASAAVAHRALGWRVRSCARCAAARLVPRAGVRLREAAAREPSAATATNR